MGLTVDLNSDMGESFGAWTMGNDEAMLDIVTSANVACGFHAGDPNVMFATARIAKDKGVAIGAHPSWPDLIGFGRRVIHGDSPAEIERMVAYQIGALMGIAAMAGHTVTHVKAHGALGNVCMVDQDVADAVARGVRAVSRDLISVAMPGLCNERAAHKAGLPYVREVFADRAYEDNGALVSRKKPGAVIHDADFAAERVLRMLQDRAVTTASGKVIAVEIDTICVHGDTPTAVAMARAIRDRLTAAGVTLRPFHETLKV
jgi:5-oxoprolinase (ATP-hydrolysing) subunit A